MIDFIQKVPSITPPSSVRDFFIARPLYSSFEHCCGMKREIDYIELCPRLCIKSIIFLLFEKSIKLVGTSFLWTIRARCFRNLNWNLIFESSLFAIDISPDILLRGNYSFFVDKKKNRFYCHRRMMNDWTSEIASNENTVVNLLSILMHNILAR